MQFRKYQATGNDFILIDNREGEIAFNEKEIQRLCDRRFGIGADGLILLNRSDASDFEMQYYNSDGSADAMCGNGGRCIAAFAYHLGVVSDGCSFNAFDGLHFAKILDTKGNKALVKLSMADCKSPLQFTEQDFFVDSGAPHLVIFTENVQKMDVARLGLERSNDHRLPCRSNVNFAAVEEGILSVRTFERGVEDETLSCGTGATATALAYAAAFFPDQEHGKIKISTRGGDLTVCFTKTDAGFGDIWLEGEAEFVFSGTILKEMDSFLPRRNKE